MLKHSRVPFTGRTVTAIVDSPEGKILLIKRGTVVFKGYWALPGGRVDTGESSEQAVIREVKEETGLEVEIVKQVGEYHEKGVQDDIEYDYYPTCFLVKIIGGKIKRQRTEIESIRFFDLEEIPQELAFDHSKMLHDYARLRKLGQLAEKIRACRKCRLYRHRINAVPGEGPVTAEIMICGQAPGRNEDREGRPFVGMAGRFLTDLLKSIGLERKRLFLTSPIKCFPPQNRPPRSDELSTCYPYLDRQIRMINPKIIVALGNYALRTLLDSKLPISAAHGLPQQRGDTIIFPTFHPAAAMRFPKIRTLIKEDFERLRKLIANTKQN